MNRHVLLRPDAQAPFAVVEEAYTLLRRNSPFPVRLFAPYFAEGARVVRLPGEFVDRNWLVGAARGLGYAVMRVEAWVEFEQTSVKAPWGTFTVNLKNDNDGGRRMRRLLYQGPPGTPPRPWPEEWTYEFEVDHDGLVSLILPPDGRLSPLDRAVMKLSKRVSPAPHPAPASVFLKLKLAR
jgi:hypothetical protein